MNLISLFILLLFSFLSPLPSAEDNCISIHTVLLVLFLPIVYATLATTCHLIKHNLQRIYLKLNDVTSKKRHFLPTTVGTGQKSKKQLL